MVNGSVTPVAGLKTFRGKEETVKARETGMSFE
jgi:hypothetical protein